MDKVYVVSGARTAVGKAGRGTLVNYRPDDMAGVAIAEAVKRAGVPPEKVEDVILGCATPEAEQGMNVARLAIVQAGLPDTTPAATINRFCSSGLEAIAICAAKIEAGLMDVAVAGGTESLSMLPMDSIKMAPNPAIVDERPEYYITMGCAGDHVAQENGFAREQLDEWALGSNEKAISAIDAGRFADEIVPLEVPVNGGSVTFDTDEGPRRDTSMEALAKLRPAFAASPKCGFHTAGNSSQTSDGAAAVTLMSEKALSDYGAKPLAKLLSYNVYADRPDFLGPAQLVAIPRACELAGIDIKDVGLFEINEAFASVALLVTGKLGIDPAKVNVNGGAIALGHPLGCTGAKLSVQMINEMRRRGEKYGVVTMCIGGGQGAAGVYELCD
jgi:acetyl-CoA acyltransferase